MSDHYEIEFEQTVTDEHGKQKKVKVKKQIAKSELKARAHGARIGITKITVPAETHSAFKKVKIEKWEKIKEEKKAKG